MRHEFGIVSVNNQTMKAYDRITIPKIGNKEVKTLPVTNY